MIAGIYYRTVDGIGGEGSAEKREPAKDIPLGSCLSKKSCRVVSTPTVKRGGSYGYYSVV